MGASREQSLRLQMQFQPRLGTAPMKMEMAHTSTISRVTLLFVSYNHGVRDQDETAEERAHHLHQDEIGFVPFILIVAFVEEAHGLIIMTAVVLLGHFRAVDGRGDSTEREDKVETEKLSVFTFESSARFHFTKIKPEQNYLDGFIGVGDEGNEERQYHVDEQGDEGVEVGPAEEPHQSVFVLQLGESGKHVVSVQQGEQALRHTTQALKLETLRGNGRLDEASKYTIPVRRYGLQHLKTCGMASPQTSSVYSFSKYTEDPGEADSTLQEIPPSHRNASTSSALTNPVKRVTFSWYGPSTIHPQKWEAEQLTWSNLTASTMERVHSTAEYILKDDERQQLALFILIVTNGTNRQSAQLTVL
ncbi:hypothetical protein FQN60_012930 [Etheostoma spectabile]|uniref:Uncharacterized protein n=1 Tax=Etheostoma spectabile TaxID=54343 RepID=A0A5J5DAD7_9PERO|nr:hypothetical protein FQN60_012930 [Etheostoma spectabile]